MAARAGIGMLLLQAAIGALNDVVDAPRDAGRKPGKPIPAGLIARRHAAVVAVIAALAGLVVSAMSGSAVLAVGTLILVVGVAYDLRFKGTPWSWLPFALGIPLLPVYGWLSAWGALPIPFVVLLPAAFLAGAALAIANALVDVERDRGAGATSIAAHLGSARAWRLHVGLLAAVVALGAGGLLALVGSPGMAVAGVSGATLLLFTGARLTAADDVGRRERGWQLEAVGMAVLGIAWIGGVARVW